MFHSLSSIGVAAVTSVVVAAATQLTVGTRLQARSIRILQAHGYRDKFSEHLLLIIASCSRLENFEVPDDFTPALAQAMEAERKRWVISVDSSTEFLIDNIETFALGYTGVGGLRSLATEYAITARFIWISERPLLRKVDLLKRMSDPIQTIFFAPFHRRLNIGKHMAAFRRVVDEAQGPN
jgi:hypothetical protein